MADSTFSYVTYIRTSPAELWSALTDPQTMKRYWFGTWCECAWTPGSSWRMWYPDGRMTDDGEILEAEPRRKIVIRWTHQLRPELKAEGQSRCTIELEPAGSAVKLSITHTIRRDHSELIKAVSVGWPMILSNLKSLLEIGAAILDRVAAA